MAFPRDSAYHADSDADDEFERSVMTSPTQVATDSETETSSGPPSNQHTPTKFAHPGEHGTFPTVPIRDWTTEECVQFLVSLNLRQYGDAFVDNSIVGEALVALKHDELKEMGITSLGHRLVILKHVYDVKVDQDVPFEADDYIPLSAEHKPQHEMATKEDIDRLARSIIKLRDDRIAQAEAQLAKLADDYRRLRLELLPVFKLAKERSEPLPYAPYGSPYGADFPDGLTSPSATIQSMPEKTGLARTISKRLGVGSSAPKNHSPTHVPTTIHEGRALSDMSTLVPSAAASHASNQLSGGMHQHSPATSTLPSPTSPMPYQSLPPRVYQGPTTVVNHYDGANDNPPRQNATPTPTIPDAPRSATQVTSKPSVPSLIPSRTESVPPGSGRSTSESQQRSSTGDGEAPSVEIFKSFRVALEDPCYKVLPAALRKYNINADWRQYALYIVYGDQERCVRLDEKPLALFKDLDREGKKPMFMLRKLANAVDAQAMPGASNMNGPGLRPLGQGVGGGGGPGMPSGASIRSMTPGSALPGGVL